MLQQTIRTILTRELFAFRRGVEAYPDDASLWRAVPGIANVGGTLVLHVCGNLRHFIGGVLGGSGYRRDRDAEFSRRGVPRPELLADIDAAIDAVARGMDATSDEALGGRYPEKVGGREVMTSDFLVHSASHLAYHLGQFDYHRRIITGDGRTIGAVAPAELPAVR
ncbi:MAG TPA: DUF664 domain-containing protein [Gemmatimonadaceae bacterium]|nr:DUF664 domain-containing protein [Gemmatimonadaceae bacterium]